MKLPSGNAVARMFDGPGGWALALAAGAVVIYLGYKAVTSIGGTAAKAAGGLLTGNNALTQNQTDAAGNPVTAYQGAGALGTLGAAANTASGGTFASIGDWIGGSLYNLFNPPPATGGANNATGTGSNTVGGNAAAPTTPSQANFGLISTSNAGW